MVGQVIRRLLGGVLPWLLAGLLGVAVYSHMQAQRYTAERDAALGRAERAEQRATILLEHQRWQREQIEALTAAVQEREALMARDAELIDMVRRTAQQLERDDAETAEWADQPMPVLVGDWVLKLSAEASDDTGDSESHGPAVRDGTTASADTSDQSQP